MPKKPHYPVRVVGYVHTAYNDLPEGMRGWNMFRIEYGGHGEMCERTDHICLPWWVSVDQLEELLNSEEPEEQEDE